MLLLRRFSTSEFESIRPKYTNLSELVLLDKKIELKNQYPELNRILNNPRVREYDIGYLESQFSQIHLNTYGENGRYRVSNIGTYTLGYFFTSLSTFMIACEWSQVFIPICIITGSGLTVTCAELNKSDYRDKIIKTTEDYSILLSILQKEKEINRLLENTSD